jgi:hypothetical protein
MGATLTSSAADLIPMANTSESHNPGATPTIRRSQLLRLDTEGNRYRATPRAPHPAVSAYGTVQPTVPTC